MSKIKELINKDPDILGGTPVFRRLTYTQVYTATMLPTAILAQWVFGWCERHS